MKSYIFILLCFLSVIHLDAQTSYNEVVNSGVYLWGEGKGKTIRLADKRALDDLVSQLSTSVQSSFQNVKVENDKNLNEYTQSVINTYSTTTLSQTKRIVLNPEVNPTVIRYIHKDEVKRIFEVRQNKIFSFLRSGLEAEKEYRIGDALKYYYWSLILLRSHSQHNEMTYPISDSTEVLLKPELYDRINKLLSNVSYKIKDIEHSSSDEKIRIDVLYQDSLVTNLSYSYWSGRDWSAPYLVRDGIGLIERVDKESLTIRLRTKYIYDRQSSIDKELSLVMEELEPLMPPFPASEYTLEIDPEMITYTEPQGDIDSTATDEAGIVSVPTISYLSTEKELAQEYGERIQTILEATRKQDTASVSRYMTPQGLDMFQDLLVYGNVEILEPTEAVRAFEVQDKVVVRGFPMLFSFENNTHKFVEKVVFTFNQEKKVEAVSFALSDKAFNDIVDKTRWPEEDKKNMIFFLENYKMAYNLKRLEYLRSVFSEHALIIVGTTLKEIEKDNSIVNKKAVYKTISKKEYMERLRYLFDQKEFVNIQFEENVIRQSKYPSVYGINIKQNYYSDNYSDVGYLFLIMDFREEDQPLIHVRTWQTEEDLKEKGSTFGLTDFF